MSEPSLDLRNPKITRMRYNNGFLIVQFSYRGKAPALMYLNQEAAECLGFVTKSEPIEQLNMSLFIGERLSAALVHATLVRQALKGETTDMETDFRRRMDPYNFIFSQEKIDVFISSIDLYLQGLHHDAMGEVNFGFLMKEINNHLSGVWRNAFIATCAKFAHAGNGSFSLPPAQCAFFNAFLLALWQWIASIAKRVNLKIQVFAPADLVKTTSHSAKTGRPVGCFFANVSDALPFHSAPAKGFRSEGKFVFWVTKFAWIGTNEKKHEGEYEII